MSVGSVSADVVAVEARKAAGRRGRDTAAATGSVLAEEVALLTGRRLAALPAGDRPSPSVDAYDQLLRRESS